MNTFKNIDLTVFLEKTNSKQYKIRIAHFRIVLNLSCFNNTKNALHFFVLF